MARGYRWECDAIDCTEHCTTGHINHPPTDWLIFTVREKERVLCPGHAVTIRALFEHPFKWLVDGCPA